MINNLSILKWSLLAFLSAVGLAMGNPTIKVVNHTELKETLFQYHTYLHNLCFSPDLTLAAWVDMEGIYVFDLKNRRPYQIISSTYISSRRNSFNCIAISRDNKWLYSSADDGDLVCWDIVPSDVIETPDGTELRPSTASGIRLDKLHGDNVGFSQNGSFIAIDGAVYQLNPFKLVLNTTAAAISFTADELFVVAYGGVLDKMADIYSFRGDSFIHDRRIAIRSTSRSLDKFSVIAYDPVFQRICQPGGNGIILWDINSGKTIAETYFQEPDISNFSPDGSLIMVKSGKGSGYSMGTVYSTPNLIEVVSEAFMSQFGIDGTRLARGISSYSLDVYKFEQLPPYLEISVTFDDTDTGANSKLDNGESAKLIVTINNTGQGSAVGLEIHSSVDNGNVSIASIEPTSAINGGAKRTIEVPISASRSADTGLAEITMSVKEINGFDSPTITLTLPINRVLPPEITIAETATIDDTPRIMPVPINIAVAEKLQGLFSIVGDGDGLLENGETALVSIPVKNNGSGDAFGVTMQVNQVMIGVTALTPNVTIGDIPPGETRYGEILVKVERSYAELSLALDLTAKDIRPAMETAIRKVALPYQKLLPNIAFSYSLHDGNTPASRGNSDSQMQVGELIEIRFALVNQGTASAEAVDVTLQSDKEGIIFALDRASCNRIDPGGPLIDLLFAFTIQRSIVPGMTPFNLQIAMQDYPNQTATLNLPIYPAETTRIELAPTTLQVHDKVWIPACPAAAGTVWDLVCDPIDQSVVYLATSDQGVLKSFDKGFTWQEANGGLTTKDVRCIALDPNHPATILVGTSSAGVFRSENGGNTWESINRGLMEIAEGQWPECRAITIRHEDPSRALLGTDQGLYLSKNGGKKWELCKKLPGKDVQLIVSLFGDLDAFLVGLRSSSIFRTSNSGESWEAIYKAVGDMSSMPSLVCDPKDPMLLYLAQGISGILKSADGGVNWIPFNEGLLVPGGDKSTSISSVAIDPSNSRNLFAISDDGRAFQTVNGGEFWQVLDREFPGTGRPHRPRIMITSDGTLFAGAEEGLFTMGDVKKIHTLPSIRFTSGSVVIGDEIREELDQIIDYLRDSPMARISATGHTDNLGDEKANLQLSLARAESLKRFLVSQGIGADRISTEGLGWLRPIAPNETPEGRGLNRRVEVLVAGPAETH